MSKLKLIELNQQLERRDSRITSIEIERDKLKERIKKLEKDLPERNVIINQAIKAIQSCELVAHDVKRIRLYEALGALEGLKVSMGLPQVVSLEAEDVMFLVVKRIRELIIEAGRHLDNL